MHRVLSKTFGGDKEQRETRKCEIRKVEVTHSSFGFHSFVFRVFVFLLEIIMTPVTFPCLECRAPISLSGPVENSHDVKCPECGAWVTVPQHILGAERERASSEESGSNAALWIGLAIGGGFLLLLLVCGGVGAFFWFLRAQQGPTMRQAAMIAPAATPMTISAATDFPAQKEDYADARKKFKTQLVREGSAPQQWQPLRPPPEVTELTFPSGDLTLKAWVSRDRDNGQKKKPAVLFLHGGNAFDLQDWQMIKPFLDAGYVVMIPMLRGENGQPGSFSMFYDEVDDVLAAADALAKLNYVDPQRMYMAGHSAGGTLALLAAMTSPRFRAAASFSGSPDQFNALGVNQWVNQAPFDTGGLGEFSNRNPEAQKEFRMRSPLAFAESFKCPVRMYLGNQEGNLRTSTQKTAELAKKKNLDVEVVEVPGDHMSAVAPAMRQCIEFFEENKEPRKK
jgi:dienelactone hydrolase